MGQCNCSNCSGCESISCFNGGVVTGAFLVPFVIETTLIAVVVGLIIWKRITVAKFLYNLQLPKMREIPQLVIRKFRRSSSTPPPEVYVERTVQNPTYDIEEGQPSAIADSADKAREPIELYEEIPPENDMSNLEEFEDNCVYDVPEALDSEQLESHTTTDVRGGEILEAYATTGEEMLVAYATTDVSGGDMLNAYAVTDISQTEGQCRAYAVTEGRLGSGSQKVVSAEVHPDRLNSNEITVRANAGLQTTPQRNVDATRVKTPGVQSTKSTPSQKDANGSKDRAKVKSAPSPLAKQQNSGSETKTKAKGKAMKPALHPKPSGGTGAKDKTGAEASKKVKFEDKDRRRSKSYTGAHWDAVIQEEQTNKSSSRSSTKGKPKPLPKKKGLIRKRGASDSGVEGYSKLDLKSQYASLEPHRNQEVNAKDAKDMKDSYSHLKH